MQLWQNALPRPTSPSIQPNLRVARSPPVFPSPLLLIASNRSVLVFSPPLIYKAEYSSVEYNRSGLTILLITELLVLSFFGIAQIGKEMEDPYGYRQHDVPLEQVRGSRDAAD